MLIRSALPADFDSVWRVLEPTIVGGETQALAPDMNREDALAYWFSANHAVFVAEEQGTVVGSYFLRANHAGAGAHVANCAYVVSPSATGSGVAQAMCEHSLAQARARGYLAMQFNLVASSDERTVRLWERTGFQTVGRLPKAFRHPSLGLVDALVMHREL